MRGAKAKAERKAPPKVEDLPIPQIKLLNDYLLVKLDSADVIKLTLEARGRLIAMPGDSKALAYLTGTVVAAGPGLVNIHFQDNNVKQLHRVPMDCTVGDRVIFQSRFQLPFTLRGEEFILLRDQNILGIL